MKQYQVISQLYENANKIYQRAVDRLQDLYQRSGLENLVTAAKNTFKTDSYGYALASNNGATVKLPTNELGGYHIMYMSKKKGKRGGGHRTSDTIDPKTGASYRTSKKAKRSAAKNLQEHQDQIKKRIRAIKKKGGIIDSQLLNEAKKCGVKVSRV